MNLEGSILMRMTYKVVLCLSAFFICLCTGIYLFTVRSTPLELLSNSNNKDKKLTKYLNKFPYDQYSIATVQNLGSFYVDDIPDGIKWHLKQGIYWESGIAEVISKHIKPNTIAIDMGAHIGIHTLLMSKKVGPDGLVISFEPQKKIYRELHHNLILNNCQKNIITLRYALGSQKQIIEMCKADPTNEGGTPVGKGGDRAPMITLDSLDLSNVSFIKMDVESYELNVLKGAKKTLRKNHPVIVFEILGGVDLDNCNAEQQATVDEIIAFLEKLEYRVQRIFGNDFLALPKNYPS